MVLCYAIVSIYMEVYSHELFRVGVYLDCGCVKEYGSPLFNVSELKVGSGEISVFST